MRAERGLGLTVAEGIVTQHGGTISASNRPEGGASLEVLSAGGVLMHDDEAAAVPAAADLVDVAVLDDDLDFRNYIEDLLRDEGNYAVRTFRRARRIVRLRREHACPISFCSI